VNKRPWVQTLDADGKCLECGTDHGGYPPDSLGARTRCIRVQAEMCDDRDLLADLDRFEEKVARQRNDFIAKWLQL
jgi:hypothetical protein